MTYYNMSNCLLLLYQQITLQNDLEKHCNLIKMMDSILEFMGLKLFKGAPIINTNLDYIIAALSDAKSTNKILISELQEYLKSLITLLKISNNIK